MNIFFINSEVRRFYIYIYNPGFRPFTNTKATYNLSHMQLWSSQDALL